VDLKIYKTILKPENLGYFERSVAKQAKVGSLG
jgi:hypothetical protein